MLKDRPAEAQPRQQSDDDGVICTVYSILDFQSNYYIFKYIHKFKWVKETFFTKYLNFRVFFRFYILPFVNNCNILLLIGRELAYFY